MASPSTPRLTDTPVATTVRTPRLRSQVSSDGAGERGDAVAAGRRPGPTGSGPELADQLGRRGAGQEVVGVAEHGRDQLAVDRRPGPVGPELGGAVDDAGTPSERAAASSRAVLGTTPARSAASASWGKELRSPTTPRWISMVSTAQSRRRGQVAQVDRHDGRCRPVSGPPSAAQCPMPSGRRRCRSPRAPRPRCSAAHR